MKFSSSSLIAAALLFLPTASSASTMPVWNCEGTDQACIDAYSYEMSEWLKNKDDNDTLEASNACNKLEENSSKYIACYKAMRGGVMGTENMICGEDAMEAMGYTPSEDSDFADYSSSPSLLRSTTTSITAAISIVMAATVLVVA